MPDQNEPVPKNAPAQSQQAQTQPKASPGVEPVVKRFANAEEARAAMAALQKERWEKKKKGLAPHEAAHAIVADDMGYTVKDVNIGRDKPQKTSIDWKGLEHVLAKVNWTDPADVAAIKPKV